MEINRNETAPVIVLTREFARVHLVYLLELLDSEFKNFNFRAELVDKEVVIYATPKKDLDETMFIEMFAFAKGCFTVLLGQ